MDPVTAGMIIQAGAGLYQLLTAEKAIEPTYERPPEVDIMLREAAARARDIPTMAPGQRQAEDRIRQSTSDAVRSATQMGGDPTQALGAAGQAAAREQAALSDLAARAEQWRSSEEGRRQAQYMQALQTGAQASEQEFQYNQWIPYQQRMNEYQSQMQSGTQNLMSGAMGAFQNVQSQQQFDQMMGMWKNQQQFGNIPPGSMGAPAATNMGVVPGYQQPVSNFPQMGVPMYT